MNRHFRNATRILAALAAVSPAGFSARNDASGIVELEPCVVTALRGDHPLRITGDTAAPAQPIPAHDGADYLKSVPGFSVVRKGGADGDPVLRGMAGSRLGILLDGELILGGCGHRMDPPTAYVFPAAYDRVTILKGPQSVLHGPGNSAGVVLFERDPSRAPRIGASGHTALTIGSFGRRDVMFDGRLDHPTGFARAAVTYSESGDFTDGDGRDVHAGYERWSANAALGWTPDAQTLVELTGARSDGKAAYADRMMDGAKFDRDNLGLRFRRQIHSGWMQSIDGQMFYNHVDHVMDNFSLRDFTPSAMMPERMASNPSRRTTGARLTARLTPAEHLDLALGFDHQDNRHDIRGSSNETLAPHTAQPRERDASFRQSGLYGEAARDLAQAGRIIAGLRVDRWRARDHREHIATGMMSTVPNPGARAVRGEDLASGFVRYERDLAAAGMLYAGLGRSERFPDYWELFSKESRGSVTAFETKPEATTQLDVGGSRTWNGVTISIAAFYSEIDDFILIESNVPKPGMMPRRATIARNIDAATWGGEAALAWRFTEGWLLDTSLAWVRGENETDDRPLAQAPPLESRTSLTYRASRWSAGVLARLVAAQDRVAVDQGNIVGQDIGASSGFAVFSLNASWRVSPFARLSAGIDNLFDRTYAEHISRAGAMIPGYTQTTRINEPGRTLWLKLDLAR